MQHSWLSSNVTAQLAAADRAAADLGALGHAQLLAASDRLARCSPSVARAAYQAAPRAWQSFGAEGFERWFALGEALVLRKPACPAAALAFFAVAPEMFGADALETAAAWCGLGHELAQVSRQWVTWFFERTPSLLAAATPEAAQANEVPGGIVRLRAWLAAGLRLHASAGWRGELLAGAYFDSAPHSITLLADHAGWVRVALALGSQADARGFFSTVPDGLARWNRQDQELFLGGIERLAADDPGSAQRVYVELPAALARTGATVRGALLGAMAQLPGRVAKDFAALVPGLGSALGRVPHTEILAALGRVRALAQRHPAAAIAALRLLPRLYEQAQPARIEHWFEVGATLFEHDAAAATAYFALESRTSHELLRAESTAVSLDETQGIWRKLIQMLSGHSVEVRAVAAAALRPPLEDTPETGTVSLPGRIDWLPTCEENSRVYRFLALQLAGRREFGSYRFQATDGSALRAHLRQPGQPALLEELFLVAEGVRIQRRLTATYAGVAAESGALALCLLQAWQSEPNPAPQRLFDTLLARAIVSGPAPAPLPVWLPPATAHAIANLLTPLSAANADVQDSIAAARRLAALLTAPVLTHPTERATRGPSDGQRALANRSPSANALRPTGADTPSVRVRGGLLREGFSVADLLEKLPGEPGASQQSAASELANAQREHVTGEDGDTEQVFFYDEWDHQIGDYRKRWCRLRELALAGDSGEFFASTLASYAKLLPQVRRQFQRVRPATYRTLRGLTDGEDFDLDAVSEARSEVRARRAPSDRLYRARVRDTRDVATLFLLDMSASTDEPLGDPHARRSGRRIIDALKEALVIMTEALDELGDAYAIYGFSGHGRTNVEFYSAKGFREALDPAVKARIGGIQPKRSTRMGAAIRHAGSKLSAHNARAKHLWLLSDGFPQDHDYGADRRSHGYGIEDTARALREVSRSGVVPFCITVDRAGHDYLRQMCQASRYLVIDDVATLPRELPKIYRRIVRD